MSDGGKKGTEVLCISIEKYVSSLVFFFFLNWTNTFFFFHFIYSVSLNLCQNRRKKVGVHVHDFCSWLNFEA